MVYFELVKVTIDAFDLTKVILNVVMQHHSLSNSIMNDQDSIFI